MSIKQISTWVFCALALLVSSSIVFPLSAADEKPAEGELAIEEGDEEVGEED